MIKRLLSERILAQLATFPALIVTGARQTGKTTLLKHLLPNFTYVTLDLPSVANLAESDPESFFAEYPPPIIIDEVQYAPGIFRHIKARIDERRDISGQFILTGSQQFNLMREVSDSLAGRCGIVQLESLSAQELQDYGLEFGTLDAVSRLITKGGMPSLWARPETDMRDYFSSYVATYLDRDVRVLGGVANLRDFERFLRACALRSAQILNKSELARDVGVSTKTADAWLSVLAASNQVQLLEPWFGNYTKRLIKSPKIYLADCGTLSFLLGLDEASIATSYHLGVHWETFVYGEIRKCLEFIVGVPSVWFYRDQSNYEVDFIIENGTDLLLIECKWGESISANRMKSLNTVSELLKSSETGKQKRIHKLVVARPSGGRSALNDGTPVVSVFQLSAELKKILGARK
jgi:uncharacterized protein